LKISQSSYQKAAKKYSPSDTRVLFVAEAPPNSIDRYFYFEDVTNADWLWIALMKELFPREWGQTKQERKRKRYWLRKFQKEGYQLIDAVKKPIVGSHPVRVQKIRAGAAELISEIKGIKPKRTILIKATVHEALIQALSESRVPVTNKASLPFPGSGRQKEFHRKFRRSRLART
jgi:hypothetical protein